MPVQDGFFETDPRKNVQEWFLNGGSDRHLLSHPESPSLQITFLRFTFEGVANQYTVHALQTVSGPLQIYEVCGQCSSPSEAHGNPHYELPQHLACESQI